MTDTVRSPGRSTFGPVLLVGLAAGALTAVASSQTWLVARGDAAGITVRAAVAGSDAAPLALALALVALASWGVILVSATRVRRLAAALGAMAALGVLVVAVTFYSDAHRVAVDALTDKGAPVVADLSRRAWYWVAGLAATAQTLVLVAAYRFAPRWPTMSSRYDAPGSTSTSPAEVSADGPEIPDLELWKALDEGRDPTAR